MGNHQKCWLWGRHSVIELLRADQWHPLELGIAADLSNSVAKEVREWAQSHHCPVTVYSARDLENLTKASDHQGLIARMPEFPYRDVGETVASLPRDAWCVLLDGIQDPFNFGAILRSAEVLGAAAAFIGGASQCGITAQVVRSSAGAVLHLPIARGEEVTAIAQSLKQNGFQLVAASEKASCAPQQRDFQIATCLVIGNEGRGISADVLTLCDGLVAIPQTGQVGSLNAAVAAGILFYEIGRQRNR